ncbi:alpha-1,4-glucan--maltose-1-phosphate maltosyltransferase [Amycolatopsis sp. cmx-4-68]|uniref:alpha-1,4-glucan--maltose-1-phosphate maltosyltransferase n=1 Tax=Amycolatopsis sp. cmx-4-68 TaxID=2790938 RepID=UPI00397B6077
MTSAFTRVGRIAVMDVSPVVEGGRWEAKAASGERVPFAATVFREGHDLVAATLVLRIEGGPERRVPMVPDPEKQPDRWVAAVDADRPGSWEFCVEGWSDPYGTWSHAVQVKVEAGQELGVELEEGALMLERAAEGVPEADRAPLLRAVAALRDTGRELPDRLSEAIGVAVRKVLDQHPLRDFVTPSPTYSIRVDRTRALYGAWYELFPRSEGAIVGPEPRSGTLRAAARRLPTIAEMGFDVVYLTPVHPIGRTWRKGRDNTRIAQPDDPGSPYAVGAPEGGHDAIHPDLGTFDDFDAFVARAQELGLEVALDLALQCSPDHPWVRQHPEWFVTRPDGTVAYAENPPKKYHDIYPLNFDLAPDGIAAEMLRIVNLWISHGVTLFRVDNPHTKPLWFWEWLIATVRRDRPDIVFLSEAFTRPPMLHALAKVGFQQSYTYFTWRNTKAELVDYLTELSSSPGADYLRPNLFVNTHDILPAYLVDGGPPAFKVRAVLAALGSPTWGVYSGYELTENVPLRAGSEDYAHSEKYEYRPRDWATAERTGTSIAGYLRTLNQFRRDHPATHQLRNLRFHDTDSEHVLAFSRTLDGDRILAVVNLDPHQTRADIVRLDLPSMGLDPWARFTVTDVFTGDQYSWRADNYVQLDPAQPAHVFSIDG